MADINEIKSVIAAQLNKSPEEITDEKEIVKDLGADSLDVIEMLMTLEEKYNITVPEEDVVNIKTVADIVNIINSKN